MNRLTINLILLVFFLNIFSLEGQTKKVIKETFFEGEMYLLYEEYKEAITSFDTLHSWFPENDNYNYRLGICYLNIPGRKEQSLAYLQSAVQNINLKYKDGKYKETASSYDAWYYLAKAYRVTNQIDKAITTYNRFLDGMNHKLYDSSLVKKELEECYNAKRLMNYPLYLKSVNQGNIINENYSEVNPVVSADEKTMLFTRETPFADFILFSRKVNDKWTPGLVIMDQLLVDEGYTTSVSGDGKELFLYRNDEYVGNIYSSQFVDGRWQPAVKLNENINTKYWESHAAISTDGSKLFFTSNREGGFGGLDIYVSERDSLGDWGPAVNLGPTVNTPFNEETPFLDKTDNVLFFSSRGHFNMGGHDVFYTTRGEDGIWLPPFNMGYPVNSTDDDTFFHPVGQGYTAYVSRFDPDGFGMQDIHRVEIFSDDHPRKFYVRGMVSLKDLLAQFNDSVKISTLNRENLDTLLIVYSDPATGEYEFEVPQGDYQVVYESDGSEKNITDLELDLQHPLDSVTVPDMELSKSDLIAEIQVLNADPDKAYSTGDSAIFNIATEPNSILIVEHWQGDSLLSSQEYIITDSLFSYKVLPELGENNIVFKVKDRFNNLTVENLKITGEEQKIIVVPEVVDPSLLLADQAIDSVIIKAETKADPTIKELKEIIAEVSDNEDIRDAVEKTRAKQIKNAGEWLESIYSVAIEDGAEQEILTRLIAALSADLDEPVEDYLARLSKYAGDNLRKVINSLDFSEIKADTPEEIIAYLLSNAEKYGYTQQEVFEAFAKLIN
ncbi:MAG: tetratricopeptide repeat protein, partial [Bacteroidales bacterium]|nr:tetratricopeptide repeat protein [Bacteroidales bacterium]